MITGSFRDKELNYWNTHLRLATQIVLKNQDLPTGREVQELVSRGRPVPIIQRRARKAFTEHTSGQRVIAGVPSRSEISVVGNQRDMLLLELPIQRCYPSIPHRNVGLAAKFGDRVRPGAGSLEPRLVHGLALYDIRSGGVEEDSVVLTLSSLTVSLLETVVIIKKDTITRFRERERELLDARLRLA